VPVAEQRQQQRFEDAILPNDRLCERRAQIGGLSLGRHVSESA
jgi:hypothetical protein